MDLYTHRQLKLGGDEYIITEREACPRENEDARREAAGDWRLRPLSPKNTLRKKPNFKVRRV
jgi:hypothetical protein